MSQCGCPGTPQRVSGLATLCVRGSGVGLWSLGRPWLRITRCHVRWENSIWRPVFGEGRSPRGGARTLSVRHSWSRDWEASRGGWESAVVGPGHGGGLAWRVKSGGARGGSRSPWVCRGPTLSLSGRPSVVPRALAIRVRPGPRSPECVATADRGNRGLPTPRGLRPTVPTGRRLGLRAVQFEGGSTRRGDGVCT